MTCLLWERIDAAMQGERPTRVNLDDPLRVVLFYVTTHVDSEGVVHFAEDIYGVHLRVHLVERLRDERKFDSLEDLRAQIARDSEAARTLLSSWEPAAGGAWA